MTDLSGPHPGRPSSPPPGWGAPPPGGTSPGPGFGGAPPPRGRSPLPWIVGGIVVVIALVVGLVVVLGGDDEAEAGEIFLEPAAETGTDPFATGLGGDAVEVTTTTLATTTTAGDSAATPSISGGRPGLYGGTRNSATCDPAQQAQFLAANRPVAQAFVAALNADPTLRWSGGTTVSVDQIDEYLAELTPVVLTSDTRVTNHGYRNGAPTPRQSVLQAGTAVLVDAYGVPRVKCNCGNPLTPPTPVQRAPVYRGPRWSGFSPTTVVVVTEVTVVIETYVLIDVQTGEPFSRPTGTTGADDGDADLPDDDTTTTSEPTETTESTVVPPTETTATTDTTSSGGDSAQFCERWAYYLDLYGEVDPSVPETVSIFEELTALAPPEVRPQMELITEAVRGAAASGSTELDDSAYPGATDAIFAVITYLQGTCGITLD